jgi:hypothetical protein
MQTTRIFEVPDTWTCTTNTTTQWMFGFIEGYAINSIEDFEEILVIPSRELDFDP